MASIEISVPARVHLAGNPSDGYGGAVLSTVVPDWAATVVASTAERFRVVGPDRSWDHLDALRDEVERVGHDSGDRLVTAALVTLDRLLPGELARPPIEIAWSTSIPRSVGLGGSSAIVVATMTAAFRLWGLDVPLAELAEAALAAEVDELGIGAGLADRVAQVWRRPVLTDNREPHPVATPVPVTAPIPATVAWSPDAAEPSGTYHQQLRARFDSGDGEVRAAMHDLACLADAGAEALLASDVDGLGTALDASLATRCSLGDVPPRALAPVDDLRSAGAAVNFAGSGGALVCVGAPLDVVQSTLRSHPGWSARPLTIS